MGRTAEREVEERHANRSLNADPEGEEHEEQRVRERMKAYDEQGVGIAHHQPAGASSEAPSEEQDDDETDDEERDGEARDGEIEAKEDEN